MYQPTRTYPFCVIVSRSPEQNIINTSSGRRSSDSLFSLDVGVVVATNVVRGDGPRHANRRCVPQNKYEPRPRPDVTVAR